MNDWSIGFQHPDYGYPMTAELRVDEGDGAAFVDGMACDDEHVPADTRPKVDAMCKRWTGRSFDSLKDMLDAFKTELGLSRSDVL